MSGKALAWSIGLALVWTAAALWTVRGLPVTPAPAPAPLRFFVAHTDRDEYRVQAHETRVEGFCTIFLRDGVRFAGICGSHTWSETVEVK